jgi:SAM-dependent methyltransferase
MFKSETVSVTPAEEVSCPACGAISGQSQATFVIYSGRGRKPWRRCLNCKAYFIVEPYVANQEVAHLNETACGREDTGRELNTFKRRMFLSVMSLLSRYCPPPATLLDVGCSYGGFLMQAKERGYNVRGFDIVPRAVEYLTAQDIPAEVCFSIGELATVEDASLDVVTCLDCHVYWFDQASELTHAYTKLKPGGYLAMRVVDKSWLFSVGLWLRRFSNAAGERVIRVAVNDHRFSMPLRSLIKVIRDVGFEVTYASPRGAMHSDRTRLPVKLSFALGSALWQAGAGMFLAPGALILARKPV